MSRSISKHQSSTSEALGDKAHCPAQGSEMKQMFAANDFACGPEQSNIRSADNVSAPSWEFNSWLDDLYDAKGIFNEEFGVFSSRTIYFASNAYVCDRMRSIPLSKLMWFLKSKRCPRPMFHLRISNFRIGDAQA